MDKLQDLANLFKALGDETRLKILQFISGQEKCVCEIIDVMDLSQPAVSHHLKILKQAKLVSDKKVGRWIYYRLNQDEIEKWITDLDHSWLQSLRNANPLPPEPSICLELEKKNQPFDI